MIPQFLREGVAALALTVPTIIVGLSAWTPVGRAAASAPAPLTRAATRDEGLERSLAGNDIVCLARVLRVARVAQGDTTGHLSHVATIEPVDWVKGGLDYDDSLTVYLPDDHDSTARALRSIAASRGDSAVLFFTDAGGYWLVDRTRRSPCGDHVGVLRVRAGRGASELVRLRRVADRVSLMGLARRADLVVIADCAPDTAGAGGASGAGGTGYARAEVAECLKGARPTDPIRIAQCCEPIAGRQLLFLRRARGGAFEPLPFALPMRRRRPSATHDVSVAEIEQVRESLRELEEKE